MNGFSMDDFYFIAVGLTFIFAIVLLICISAIVKRLDKVVDALNNVAGVKTVENEARKRNQKRIQEAIDNAFCDLGGNLDPNDDFYVRVEQSDDVYASKTTTEPVDNIIPFKGKDGK